MNLYDFYTDDAYDTQPEIEAIAEHVNTSTLFVGNYASAALAVHFEQAYAAVPDQDVLFACQTENDADIRYAGAKLTHLPYPDDAFEVVIATYLMTHTRPDVLRELVRVCKKKLILIEADPTSEYVAVLQRIQKRDVPEPTALFDMLEGFSIVEETIESTYTFRDEEHFNDYFTSELRYHEGTEIEDVTEYYEQVVGERAIMLVCTK